MPCGFGDHASADAHGDGDQLLRTPSQGLSDGERPGPRRGGAVLTLWEELGHYSRARRLHQAAQQVQGVYGAKLPANCDVLQSLPGVRPYTAGTIASVAFHLRHPTLTAMRSGSSPGSSPGMTTPAAGTTARLFKESPVENFIGTNRDLTRCRLHLLPRREPSSFLA